MTHITIYEQDCCGQKQFRVMRDDGGLIFGSIATDFATHKEAVSAILGEFRRKKLGAVHITSSSPGLPDCHMTVEHGEGKEVASDD